MALFHEGRAIVNLKGSLGENSIKDNDLLLARAIKNSGVNTSNELERIRQLILTDSRVSQRLEQVFFRIVFTIIIVVRHNQN